MHKDTMNTNPDENINSTSIKPKNKSLFGLGLALGAALTGALGIVLALFAFVDIVSDLSDDSMLPRTSQEAIGLTGLILILLSSILSITAILKKKNKKACLIILALMSLPTIVALCVVVSLDYSFLNLP